MRFDPRSRIGTKVAGRYRVTSELSRGGMGIVFRAMQEPLEREIALKIMLPGPAADQTLRRRFIQEAQALSRTVHPNIVTIFDFGEVEDGSLFIAMELVNGLNLRELLQASGRVSWQDSLQMIIGATRALVAAHAGGITHRDLKPDNIMLIGSRWRADDVKLLDFGLARTLGENDGLTQINVIPGTPHYIAPERVSSKVDDPRSDLYALGAIWFELLTARLPFEGDTVGAILLAHVQKVAPSIKEVDASLRVPQRVERLITRLLAKQPADRWGSAQAFLADLEAVAGQVADEIPGPPVMSTPLPAGPRAATSRWTQSSGLNRAEPGLVVDGSRARTPAPATFPLPSRPKVVAPPGPSGRSESDAFAAAPTPPGNVAPGAAAPPPVARPPGAPAPVGRRAADVPRSSAAATPRPKIPPPLAVGTEPISVEHEFDPTSRRLVCAAVFRGRLLRKVELVAPPLRADQLDAWLASSLEDFTAGLRSLAAKAPLDQGLPAPERAESRLFFFALEAWLAGDRDTALRTIESLRLALPDDARLANTHKKLLLELSGG